MNYKLLTIFRMKTFKLILVSSFFLLFISLSKIIAETITVKCYMDEEKFYSFLINKEKKEVLWLDQNNQKLIVSIFPVVEKGGNLMIMGGTDPNNVKYTFMLDVTKAIINVITNLGDSKVGKCGNKSIFERKNLKDDWNE